jgi:acylglycerol lipase
LLLCLDMPVRAPGVIAGPAAIERAGADALASLAGPPPVWIQGPRGYSIPVRRFGADGPRRPVVMLHGLESHSGWFVQSAGHIATLGLPVHVFDRVGSGVSKASSDRWFRLDDLFAEIDAVADAALAGRRHDSIHLFGHCFGALVALLYAALHRPARIASLVLATPALYTRTDLAAGAKLRVLWSVIWGSGERIPIPLSPEEFSELAPFVQLVRNDPLVLRTAPARLFYEIRRARRRLRQAAGALRAPLLVAMAGEDPICDNPRNRHLLERVTTEKEIREYPGARHILEFSQARDAFLHDLAAWYLHRESG